MSESRILDEQSAESDESADSAESAVTAGPEPSGGRTRTLAISWQRGLVALLIVVLAGTSGYLGYQLQQQNALSAARTAASDAGKRYAINLTSYDFRDLDGNFQAVAKNSSPKFAKEYKEVSDNLSKLIKQYQATSQGVVLQQGVVSADRNRAVLTLFVDQTITNTNSPQPRVDRNRMRMSLIRSGERWLLDDLQLL